MHAGDPLMASQQSGLVQEPPENYMRQEGMDDEHLAALARSADAVAAVVGGRVGFPFHTAILSQKSKFLAGMVEEMADGGVEEQSSKRRRVQAGETKKGLLCIEAPFADVGPDAIRAFMRIAYSTTTAADAVTELAGQAGSSGDEWRELDFAALAQLVELADQLAAPVTVAALDTAVAGLLSPSLLSPTAAAHSSRLWALLALADGHREQLPKAYQAAVDATVKAAAVSCTGSHQGGPPLQRLLAHSNLCGSLSPQNLCIVLGSLVSTVRCVGRYEQLATVAPKPARTQRGPFSGSFTWEWLPGFGVDDPRATQAQLSPAFDVGGVEWEVQGYLNGNYPSERGHVSLFVGAHAVAAAGRKANRFIKNVGLEEQGLLVDGVLTVQVELNGVWVYDMTAQRCLQLVSTFGGALAESMTPLVAAGVPAALAPGAAGAARALSHLGASTSCPAAVPRPPRRGRSFTCAAGTKEQSLQTIRGVGPAYEALLRKKEIDSVQRLLEVLHGRFQGDREQLLQFLSAEVGIKNSHHCRAVADYIQSQPWEAEAGGAAAGGAAAAARSAVKLAVEGNIGAGKSTFLSIMADSRLELQDILEARRGGGLSGAQGGRGSGCLPRPPAPSPCAGPRSRLPATPGSPSPAPRPLGLPVPGPRSLAGASSQVVPEPVDLWQNFDQLIGAPRRNLLHEFYADPSGNAYIFQHYVLLTRMQKDRAARLSAKPLRVLERSIFSDRMVFVRAMHDAGYLSDLELGVYDSWLNEEVAVDAQLTPGGFIYLRAQPQTCFVRLQARARSEEVGVDEGYLGKLHEAHEAWLCAGARALDQFLEQRAILHTIHRLRRTQRGLEVSPSLAAASRDGRTLVMDPLGADLGKKVPDSIKDNIFFLKGQHHTSNDARIADHLRGVPALVLDHEQDAILHDRRGPSHRDERRRTARCAARGGGRAARGGRASGCERAASAPRPWRTFRAPGEAASGPCSPPSLPSAFSHSSPSRLACPLSPSRDAREDYASKVADFSRFVGTLQSDGYRLAGSGVLDLLSPGPYRELQELAGRLEKLEQEREERHARRVDADASSLEEARDAAAIADARFRLLALLDKEGMREKILQAA
eukprot:scaffold5.g815.t1